VSLYRRMADLGENDGQIWKESTSEGQEGYGGAEERNLEKRKVKEESHEPETGDRYRTFRGSSCGRKGAEEESLIQEEDVVQKENLYEEKIRVPEEEIIQLIATRRLPRGSPRDPFAKAGMTRSARELFP